MTLDGERMDSPSTLHLAYSFACNLSCAHCIFRCGPEVRRKMGVARAKAFIEEAQRAGIRRIVFTGGEPLLHPRELRILLDHTAGRGMQSALITNAAWASSKVRAKALLSDLKDTGLRSVTLSTDRYHLLQVALTKVQTALEAAEEIGLQARIKIARLHHDPVAEGLCRSLQDSAARVLVQDIVPLGRATRLRSEVTRLPCASFTGPGCSAPPLLRPDGDLLTCCNLPARDVRPTDSPFVLGSLERESLRSLMEKRYTDALLRALRSDGPGPLLAPLSRSESSFEHANNALYQSRCDLCFHLFCRPRDKSSLYSTVRTQTETTHERLRAFS